MGARICLIALIVFATEVCMCCGSGSKYPKLMSADMLRMARGLALRGGGRTEAQRQAWEQTKQYRAELDQAEREQDEDIRDRTQRQLDELDAEVESRERQKQLEIEKDGPKWKPVLNQHFMDPDNYTQDFGPEYHPAYPITPTDFMMDPATQMRESACRGRTEELIQLVKSGADINKPDPNGKYAAIHWAALMGQTDALHALIELGANISATTRYWRTPLHYAAEEGQDPCVQALLQAGADVNVQDRDGATPADLAAIAGKASAVQLLREGGRVEKSTNVV